jgi:hypothetical protein
MNEHQTIFNVEPTHLAKVFMQASARAGLTNTSFSSCLRRGTPGLPQAPPAVASLGGPRIKKCLVDIFSEAPDCRGGHFFYFLLQKKRVHTGTGMPNPLTHPRIDPSTNKSFSMDVNIYFDNFKVEQINSPVVQTEDFYPFGLTFNEYSREGSLQNKYLYN